MKLFRTRSWQVIKIQRTAIRSEQIPKYNQHYNSTSLAGGGREIAILDGDLGASMFIKHGMIASQVAEKSIQILNIMNDLGVDLPPVIVFAQDHIPGNAIITEFRPTDFPGCQRESNHNFILGLFFDLEP